MTLQIITARAGCAAELAVQVCDIYVVQTYAAIPRGAVFHCVKTALFSGKFPAVIGNADTKPTTVVAASLV